MCVEKAQKETGSLVSGEVFALLFKALQHTCWP